MIRRRYLAKLIFKILFERRFHNRALFVHSFGDAESVRAYGVKADIVETTRGLDEGLAAAAAHALAVRLKQSGTDGPLKLVFMGRLAIRHKGLDALLSAIALVGSGEVKLSIIGPSVDGSEVTLRRMAVTLGIQEQVDFIGPRFGDEKLRYLVQSDVFIHPSRWEGGIPNAIVEAAALGTPIICTDAADPTGLLHRHNAAIITACNPTDIADGIRAARAMPLNRRNDIGRNAHELVLREFSGEATAQTLIEAVSDRIVP